MTIVQKVFDKVDRFLDLFRNWKRKKYSGTGLYRIRKSTWLKPSLPIRYISKRRGRAVDHNPKKLAEEYRKRFGEDLFGDE